MILDLYYVPVVTAGFSILDIEQKIQLAGKLADISGEIIRQYFRQARLFTETKIGEISSIVTLADRATEAAMIAILQKETPETGIIREEGKNIAAKNGYYWVLDPIDGTSAFVRGLPIFGTLIGFVDCQHNLPILGIVNQPILQERWLGIHGQPTQFNCRPIVNSYAKDRHWKLADACLISTTPFMFVTEAQKAAAKKLQAICQRQAFGGDCYNYVMLASGCSSLPIVIIEADMKYYDFCALIPIIEGAGGAISDWSGNPLTPKSTEVLAASNTWLLQQALAAIAPS